MENIIKVKNLVKKYSKSKDTAVKNISFRVKTGEFFAFLGPNGAGKTTTLSILNTTLSKTSGHIIIAGHDIDEHPDLVRSEIGVIFQNPSLDLNLTAEENVRFHANLYGLYPYRPTFSLMPQNYKNKVLHLAEILDLSNKAIFSPVKELSGGMKRKLEIIRGLMHDPKVLFLDEPTTGLDPVSRRNLWNYLMQIRKEQNVTIFLTTHYLEEAENSDYIVIIKEGEIVSKGTPKEIKNELIEEYMVVKANDSKKLANELTKLKLDYSGDNPFKIKLNGTYVHKILKSIDTELTEVKIHSPTLEEAYINIIESGENA